MPGLSTANLTIQGIATSFFLGPDGNANIRVYYQGDMSTGIVRRRFNQGGNFSEPEFLSLSIEPKSETPLAATSYVDSGGNLLVSE